MFSRKKANLGVSFWRVRARFVDLHRTRITIEEPKLVAPQIEESDAFEPDRPVPKWLRDRFQVEWPVDFTIDSVTEFQACGLKLGLATKPT